MQLIHNLSQKNLIFIWFTLHFKLYLCPLISIIPIVSAISIQPTHKKYLLYCFHGNCLQFFIQLGNFKTTTFLFFRPWENFIIMKLNCNVKLRITKYNEACLQCSGCLYNLRRQPKYSWVHGLSYIFNYTFISENLQRANL